MSWNPTDSPESKPRFRAGSSRVRHATIAAAAIVAGGTAYAANQSKKAAAKAAKAAGQPSNIDQTSTTTQTGWAPAQDQLQYALDQTRAMYDAGPVTRLGGGKVQYDTRPDGRVVPVGGKPGKGGGGGGKGAGKGGAKAPTAKQQQKDIAQKITDTAMAGAPNQKAADDYVGRVLEEGSIGGNEVNQDLYERLKGSDLGRGEDLLTNFLGGKYGGGGQESGGGGARGERINYNTVAQAYGGGGGDAAVSGGSPPGGYGPGGAGWNAIPDSTTSPGLFNDYAKDVLGGKYLDPNDPALKDYLDMQQRRGQEGLDAQLQDVGDEFEGVGMYGGSGLALERSLARSRGLQGIADERTAALMGYREQGMNLMGQTAGQVNTRDISAGQIASSEREGAANRSASASASGNALAGQMQIANRGMDLEAIQSYLQNNQFGISQLAGLGENVSADRLGAIDRMKGLEDVRYGGLNNAFGVQGDLRKQDDAAAATAAANRRRQEDLAYQDRLAPGRHLDEYLNRLGFFNSAGGTSSTHTTGTTTNPGAAAPYIASQGPGALSAGIAAGAGTYFQGAAAGGGYQPQQQPPPRQSNYIDPSQPWLGSR